MIRTDHYKLLRKPDGSELFYDLAKDPEEATSLAQSTDANLERAHASL